MIGFAGVFSEFLKYFTIKYKNSLSDTWEKIPRSY